MHLILHQSVIESQYNLLGLNSHDHGFCLYLLKIPNKLWVILNASLNAWLRDHLKIYNPQNLICSALTDHLVSSFIDNAV